MTKAVLTHRAGSSYDDLPELRYHFPASYLRQIERALGDWILYYEPRRDNGRQVYFATARIQAIEADPGRPDHFYARISDYLEFPRPVPFREGTGHFYESLLRKPDGSASKGAFGRSVRNIPDPEFDAILRTGLTTDPAALGLSQSAYTVDGFADPQTAFERPIVEQLMRRPFREAAFARQVKIVYRNRCALTGLSLTNGGGRPEVQAAHIRPVNHDGPDSVRNGLALSGTAHWMFDRGLLSIDDDYSVLIAEDKVPVDTVERLLLPDRRLLLPNHAHALPHPAYLRYHREHIFDRRG